MQNFNKIDMDFLKKRALLKWGNWEKDIISLSVADIDFKVPEEIKEGIIQAVYEDRTPYSSYGGDPDVLDVVREKIRTVNHIPAVHDDVHMIPGTMFAIFLACYYALQPGDEALICPAPIYPPFIENVLNVKGIPVFNPIDFEDHCVLDLEDLERKISSNTKLLMVSNPHNPTGRVLTRDELTGIAEIAEKHDLLIFSDELYEDMIYEGKHISISSLSPEIFKRTITVFGFSKAFGIPGYRIAYIVCHGKVMQDLKKLLHGMIVHADTLAQAAAKAALVHGNPWLRELMNHLRQMRDFGLARLQKLPGVQCHAPQATPFLFPCISFFGKTSEAMTEYLKEEARVIVQSGSSFGPPGEGHVRINFATSRSVLKEAFNRMELALSKIA